MNESSIPQPHDQEQDYPKLREDELMGCETIAEELSATKKEIATIRQRSYRHYTAEETAAIESIETGLNDLAAEARILYEKIKES
jgi:hypothetical protein